MSDNVMLLFKIAIFLIVTKGIFSWYFASYPFYRYKILMVDKWFIPLYNSGYGHWYVIDGYGRTHAKENIISTFDRSFWKSSKFGALKVIVKHKRNLKQEELTKKIDLAKKQSIKTKYYR